MKFIIVRRKKMRRKIFGQRRKRKTDKEKKKTDKEKEEKIGEVKYLVSRGEEKQRRKRRITQKKRTTEKEKEENFLRRKIFGQFRGRIMN